MATYNIENYVSTNRMTEAGYRKDYPKPESEKRALRTVMRALDADVLVLQEMGPRAYLDELQRDLKAEGLDYPHVALAEAADACALEVAGYTSQSMFLLGCGLDRVLSRQMTGNAAANLRINAVARQLTLPGNMGERFQVMALTSDLDPGGPETP